MDFYQYPNGIACKEYPTKVRPVVNISWTLKLADKENVEILKSQPQDHSELIQSLQNLFEIKGCSFSDVQVMHLIKKDNGFSRISQMDLGIPYDSKIVLVNSSRLPKGYKFFNLSEDMRDKNLPWIHFYQFKPETAMIVDYAAFMRMSLTPLEELIYRDEETDRWKTDGKEGHREACHSNRSFYFS